MDNSSRHLSKEDIQMASDGHMKTCFTCLILQEMEIKSAVRHGFVPVGIVSYQKERNSKGWWGCGEKGPCWWECSLAQALWQTVSRFLTLEIDLPYRPAFHVWVYIQRKESGNTGRVVCTPMFIEVAFTLARIRTQPRVCLGSVHGWLAEESVLSLHSAVGSRCKEVRSCSLQPCKGVWRWLGQQKNKLGPERWVPHVFCSCVGLKVNLLEVGNRIVVLRDRQGNRWREQGRVDYRVKTNDDHNLLYFCISK